MLIEAKKINTSLSALGKVIQALSESKSCHVPYRDSKLTRLLQESIGGNSLTRLIINVSPSCIDEYETITSLRFASRAKLIKNKPKVNKEYTVEELQILL
jgi:kinesin family protein 5